MAHWEEQTTAGSDSDIAWYEMGTGPEVLFLHGNVDHVVYMPMLAAQQNNFRALLLKQRGADCWRSLEGCNVLPIGPFLDDIERLREHKGGGKLLLVGHSWGASLALHYASVYPDHVSKLVLIGPGPLSDEMSEVYRANVRRLVHPGKLDRFDEIGQRFNEEFMSGKGVSREVDEEYADVCSEVWAYSAEKSREIKRQYLEAGGFRRVAAGAARGDAEELLKRIERIHCPVLIIYGYQDYEPITQAYVIRERITHARISFINRCGHFVWVDQPTQFFQVLKEFVRGREAPHRAVTARCPHAHGG